ncbi:MAG: type II CAAX endopeptidase family protein [Archangium sp.]
MTLRRAFALIAVFCVTVFAIRAIVHFTTNPERPYDSTPTFWVVWLISSAFAALVLVRQASVKNGHGSWRQLGWHADALAPHLALGVAVGALSITINVLTSLVVGATLSEDLETITGYSSSERAVFIAIGLQAAFIEESLFRGNLQPLLVARWGRVVGLLATAAIFSAYHLDPRPFSLASKFCVGLVYGAARELTRGSLVASGFGHFLVWTTVGSF